MTTFTTQDRQDAQRTPLTKEQIDTILIPFVMAQFQLNKPAQNFDYTAFARAIERAHGIGE